MLRMPLKKQTKRTPYLRDAHGKCSVLHLGPFLSIFKRKVEDTLKMITTSLEHSKAAVHILTYFMFSDFKIFGFRF